VGEVGGFGWSNYLVQVLIAPDKNVVLAIHKQPEIIPPALNNGESHAFSRVYCACRS
jgi:hypothetical protein